MQYSARRPFALLTSGFVLLQCTPDFDSLSAGHPGGGDGHGGSGANGGTQTGGAGSGGAETGGDPAGGSTNVDASGAAGLDAGGTPSAPDAGGAGGQTEAGQGGGGAGGDGGDGGDGGAASCSFAPLGASTFVTFDVGLNGPGFVGSSATCTVDTTKAATCNSTWDATVGSGCPGSLRVEASYQEYASGADPNEIVYGTLSFNDANWTSATALHAMVRVAPVSPPIEGVRLFVVSGTNYRYTSVLDSEDFKNGDWNEISLELVPGTYFDPTLVKQIGVELRLKRAGAAGIPAQPPTVDVWLDDIWLEN
jgi:hypothetical protein